MDKEILDGFRQESRQILGELEYIVESLQQPDPSIYRQQLADFSQKIDRIMGAAKTIAIEMPNHEGLIRIGQISGLCKELGYKAATLNVTSLLPLFAAFWADTLEVLNVLISNLDIKPNKAKLAPFSAVLQARLEWLANKLNEQSKDSGIPSTIDVKQLLKELGL